MGINSWGVKVTEIFDISEQLSLSIFSTHKKKSKQHLESDIHVTTVTCCLLEVEQVLGKYWERKKIQERLEALKKSRREVLL